MAVPETLKRDFATKFRADLTTLVQAADRCNTAYKKYTTRTFAPAGADEIIDDHLAILGITANELLSGMTLIENLNKFRNNDPTLVDGDYESIFNKLRTDI